MYTKFQNVILPKFSRPQKSILKFAKTYWKSMEIPNSAIVFIKILFFISDDSFADIFSLCSMNKILEKWR